MPRFKDYDIIVWSPQSEEDLDSILEYYLEVTPEKAHQHIINILDSIEKIIFSNQWQVDEYDSTCRRAIIARKFRVLCQFNFVMSQR